ncbi:MAG: hypothetical protein ACRCT2_02030 [Plesiomonas shigelloides]
MEALASAEAITVATLASALYMEDLPVDGRLDSEWVTHTEQCYILNLQTR